MAAVAQLFKGHPPPSDEVMTWGKAEGYFLHLIDTQQWVQPLLTKFEEFCVSIKASESLKWIEATWAMQRHFPKKLTIDSTPEQQRALARIIVDLGAATAEIAQTYGKVNFKNDLMEQDFETALGYARDVLNPPQQGNGQQGGPPAVPSKQELRRHLAMVAIGHEAPRLPLALIKTAHDKILIIRAFVLVQVRGNWVHFVTKKDQGYAYYKQWWKENRNLYEAWQAEQAKIAEQKKQKMHQAKREYYNEYLGQDSREDAFAMMPYDYDFSHRSNSRSHYHQDWEPNHHGRWVGSDYDMPVHAHDSMGENLMFSTLSAVVLLLVALVCGVVFVLLYVIVKGSKGFGGNRSYRAMKQFNEEEEDGSVL